MAGNVWLTFHGYAAPLLCVRIYIYTFFVVVLCGRRPRLVCRQRKQIEKRRRLNNPQVLNQSTSLDGLKKSEGYPGSLVEHFYAVFGPKDSEGFKAAQRRFACSLAG